MPRIRALAVLLALPALVAIGQVTVVPIDPGAGDTSATQDPPPVPFYLWQQRVWAAYALSSARITEDNPMGMGWGFQDPGYSPARFVQDHLQPMADLGVRRFLLHRPWGDNATWPMDGDAQVEAMEAGRQQVLGWGPALQAFLEANPDVVVMLYVGSFREPDTTALVDNGDTQAALFRLVLSTAGVMDVDRCWLAFDHAGTYQEGTWRAYWLLLVRDMMERGGRRCYLEAWPRVDQPWQADWDAICLERYFQRSRPPGDTYGGPTYADAAHNVATQDMQGDVIRWSTGRTMERGQEAERIALVLSQGHSVALGLHRLLRTEGVALHDLYTESMEAWPAPAAPPRGSPDAGATGASR